MTWPNTFPPRLVTGAIYRLTRRLTGERRGDDSALHLARRGSRDLVHDVDHPRTLELGQVLAAMGDQLAGVRGAAQNHRCRGLLAQFKCPRVIHIVDEIPRILTWSSRVIPHHSNSTSIRLFRRGCAEGHRPVACPEPAEGPGV